VAAGRAISVLLSDRFCATPEAGKYVATQARATHKCKFRAVISDLISKLPPTLDPRL
jgi:hypothetical protein